jgi:hypothetical protein
VLAVSSIAIPAEAEASGHREQQWRQQQHHHHQHQQRNHRRDRGSDVGAVLGGIALGIIINEAINQGGGHRAPVIINPHRGGGYDPQRDWERQQRQCDNLARQYEVARERLYFQGRDGYSYDERRKLQRMEDNMARRGCHFR